MKSVRRASSFAVDPDNESTRASESRFAFFGLLLYACRMDFAGFDLKQPWTS
jgi:hypothetical protein